MPIALRLKRRGRAVARGWLLPPERTSVRHLPDRSFAGRRGRPATTNIAQNRACEVLEAGRISEVHAPFSVQCVQRELLAGAEKRGS
jgi:hypothetical protein